MAEETPKPEASGSQNDRPKQSSAPKAKTPEELDERRREAFRLRVQGHSYREIGRRIGITESVAHTDVKVILASNRKNCSEDIEEARSLELMRIDAAITEINRILDFECDVASHDSNGEQAANPIAELKLKAIDRLAKMQERRAKLIGLDAPEKVDVTNREVSPTEAARLVREQFGGHAAKSEPGSEPGA